MPDDVSPDVDPRTIDDVLQQDAFSLDDTQNENAKKWWSFGDKADNRKPLGQRNYPDANALADARMYGTAYGQPVEGYINRTANIAAPDINDVPDILYGRRGKTYTDRMVPVDEAVAEQMARAHAAVNRTAIAGLGFDPSYIAASPRSSSGLTAAGTYDPNKDQIWYDMNYPSTAVHESIHRGINKLRDAGLISPQDQVDEEHIVRAFMSRHFGDVEMGRGAGGDEQVNAARSHISKRRLDNIEQLAADQIVKRRPRGPI